MEKLSTGEGKTAVKVLYEYSSAFVFVFIYRLVDGKMVDNPRLIKPDSDIFCFDFNDMLDESVKMKPAYEYSSNSKYFDEETGLANYVEEFSSRLSQYGQAVLKGDFSVLSQMERIIKARAKNSQ